MQLRKTIWMLTALSAMSLVMTGCPEDGEESLTCSADGDCIEGEICHPTAGVCVQTCDTANNTCPSSARTCAAISTTDTRTVCQCSTDPLCNDGQDTDLVCSTLDKVCTPKCTADTDCSTGRTCDTTTGQCKAGTGPGPTTCSGTSQSTCSYGSYCSNSQCTAAPVAPTTCENFPANDRPNWSATSSNGPVIYEVGFIRYETNSSYCAGSAPDAFIVRVRAYRTDADWPATRGGVAGFFYVNTGTTEFDVITAGLLVPNTGYNRNTSNPKDAEFQVYLCRPSGSSTLQTGFYFTGGNPVCQQVSR